MANRHKQDAFILIVTADPTLPYDKAALQAGYSKKRAKTVASLMRKHAGVQAKIQAILNRKLQAAPTIDTYHATLNSAKEAALRNNSSTSAWVLLQIANLEGREVLQPDPEDNEKPPAVLVKFVPPLPAEEAQAINASAVQFERMIGAPPGFAGRVEPEPGPPPEEAPLEPPLRANERKEVCSHHGEFVSKKDGRTRAWSVCPGCIADADKDLRWMGSLISAGDGRVN